MAASQAGAAHPESAAVRELTGAEIVIRALLDEGVEVIFGYPGGAVLPIYDVLFGQNELRHILVRHEPGAIHAAEGYARSTGKVGVLLVTSGPGATNTVTGLTDAMMDSIPIVCLTGQVATHLIGNDAFQEADTVGITRPCTKHNYLVRDVDDLGRVIHEAFYVARSGRPGPVVVDLPKDVQFAAGRYAPPEDVGHRTYRPRTRGDGAAIEAAVSDALGSRDFLLSPAYPYPAEPIKRFDARANDTYHASLFNASHHPALVVPMGFADGLPVGLQIVGRMHDDATVLQIGHAFQQVTSHQEQRPPE